MKGRPGESRNSDRQPARQRVAGWLSGGTSTLSLSEGKLIVKSTGRDPHLSYQLPRPISETSPTLHVTMSSDASGRGQIFWRERGVPRFSAANSQTFEIQHDGHPHTYVVPCPTASPMLDIRIDPSNGSGTIQISAVRLTNDAGKTLYEWSF